MSVVDGDLKVYGVDNLRIADGSVMPRTTACDTMAPCVVIGERTGEMLRIAHRLLHLAFVGSTLSPLGAHSTVEFFPRSFRGPIHFCFQFLRDEDIWE
jgi:3-deoxy-D-manno-octulosonic-acid transferase